MKHYLGIITTLTFCFFAINCKFDKSIKRDFENEITTFSEGLSAKEVYVSSADEQLDNNVFFYGQKINTNFENMDGFTVEEGKYFPKMAVTVTSKTEDTIMFSDNLLDSKNGLDTSLKTLYGELILANPMHSGEKYKAKYDIYDTKGSGAFSSTMSFTLKPNPNITVKESGLQAKEVYIFNNDTKTVRANSNMMSNENLQFQFEGLKGYKVVDGFVALGLSINVYDANGKQIVHNSDAFKDTLVTENQIEEGIGGTLVFSKGRVSNPLIWEVEIWDKNNASRIKGSMQLKLN